MALLCVLLLLPARPAAAQTPLAASAGGAGGLVAGTVVSIGLVVFNARTERDFIESPADMIGLNGIPVPLGIAAGIALGLDDADRLRHVGGWAGAGLLVGTGVGALIGEAVTEDDPSGKWAGGVMGAAAGVVLGALIGWL